MEKEYRLRLDEKGMEETTNSVVKTYKIQNYRLRLSKESQYFHIFFILFHI